MIKNKETKKKVIKKFRDTRIDYVGIKKLTWIINFLNNLSVGDPIPNEDILKNILYYFSSTEKDKMLNSIYCYMKKYLKRHKVRYRFGIKRIQEDQEDREYSDAFWLTLDNKPGTDVFALNVLLKGLLRIREESENKQYDKTIPEKIETISNTFKLSGVEKEILTFECLFKLDDQTHDLYGNVKDHLTMSSHDKYAEIVHLFLDIPKNDVIVASLQTSKLLKYGLLEYTSDGMSITISPEILKYISGKENTPFKDMYFMEYTAETMPFDKHVVDKKDTDIVTAVISHKIKDKGINILMYGLPGTGKTEFSRSLGKHTGKKIYEIKNMLHKESSEEKENRSFFRYRALNTCQRMVEQEESIIIVDEADELLNTNTSYFSSNTLEKGQINTILDSTKNIIIWVTNRYDNIDESTMRRFDYSIEFGKLTFRQRKLVWHTNLEKYGISDIFTPEEIEKFIINYEINAGCINIVLQNISRFKNSGIEKGTMKSMLEKMIKANLQVTGGITFIDTKKPNAPFYSLEGINIKANVPSTIKMLEKFNTIWSDPLESMPMKNMNILLYGPPGTGKTEFAKYVARMLNRCLIIKQASDLLSCWVGETEKTIKNSFQEAEKDKAILFIDEADSMLGSREGATHSWEITQVNEILTNMETFHGMLICSTNFKKVVDNAAMRRFNVKLEFDYLTPQGSLIFYDLFLLALTDAPLTDKDAERIKSIPETTPGDFKVVYQKFLLFDKSEITHEKLIDNLNQELIARDLKFGKTMGFLKREDDNK